MKVLLLSLFALIFLAGCGSSTQPNPNAKPKWTIFPPNDGKVYGLGVAPIHVSGRLNMQRASAISQAIDEIARQKGVKVSNTLERIQKVVGGASSSAMRNYSIQSVDGQTVKAVIKDFWQDPYDKRIYILMMEQ